VFSSRCATRQFLVRSARLDDLSFSEWLSAGSLVKYCAATG